MGNTDRVRNIVVVEDESSVRRLILDILKPEGYRLLPFPDAQEALQWIDGTQEEIDLVITDIKMPGMSGKDLADRLCRSHPGTTVLFISGYSEYEQKDLNSCANPGGFYLAKPFLPSQLIRMVSQTLRSRAAPK